MGLGIGRSVRALLLASRDRLAAELIDSGDDPLLGDLLQYLQSLGAHSLPHMGTRSLFDHLIGTKDILHRWAMPAYLIRAGLFHSVYSTDSFKRRLLDLRQRRTLRGILGTAAEHLVYLFGSIDRVSFFAALAAKRDAGCDVDTLIVQRRSGGDTPISITSSEARDLLIIYIANLADQNGDTAGPGFWLSHASKLVELLRFLGGAISGSVWEHSSPITPDSERILLASYTTAFSTSAWCDVASIAPFIIPGEVHVWNGFQLASQGHSEAATVEATRGIAQLALFGTSWDKRLTLAEWQFIGTAIVHNDARVSQAIKHPTIIHNPIILHELLHHQIHTPSQLLDSLDISSASDYDGAESDFYRPLQHVRDVNRCLVAHGTGEYVGLRRKPVWDTRGVPIAAALEASFELIEGEISRLDASLYQREAERIPRKGSWDVIMLYERGRKHIINSFLCPTVTRIIERYDTMRTITGLIYVSRMRPGTRIQRHRGPTNLRLRLHMGISIPPDGCGLQVGNERISWAKGKCILFDDFFEHEAWNDSDEDRVVLIVDLWHPDISRGERSILKDIQNYAFRESRNLAQYWAANEQAAMERRIGYD